MTTHSYRVEHVTGRTGTPLVAVCSCGWRSDPFANGGMAGAAWDRHVTESEAQR